MSTTKREIIEGAFSDIGLAAFTFDISTEETTDALRKLDRMVAQWDSRGLRIGYALPTSPGNSSPAEIAGVPDIYASALVQNLAMLLAPSYGKTITQDMRINAKQSYSDLVARVAGRDIVEMRYPDTLPIGTGNKPFRGDSTQQFFTLPDQLNTGEDGLLEL